MIPSSPDRHNLSQFRWSGPNRHRHVHRRRRYSLRRRRRIRLGRRQCHRAIPTINKVVQRHPLVRLARLRREGANARQSKLLLEDQLDNVPRSDRFSLHRTDRRFEGVDVVEAVVELDRREGGPGREDGVGSPLKTLFSFIYGGRENALTSLRYTQFTSPNKFFNQSSSTLSIEKILTIHCGGSSGTPSAPLIRPW